jgi:lipopolysaccharide/colanic/teichoic acid biosynthesis glycosyltransferase
MKDDPRVTSVGRLLRRFSLDELPQLFNVLAGSMSLVGPRPELPYLAEKYEPWQRQRFDVLPGITGWWQINSRSDKPMQLHIEDDLYYIQNYSIWLDLRILVRTIWVVLSGKGAY